MPRPGRNTLLTFGAGGFAYSAAGGGARWPHPFKPSLGLVGISFSRGLVDGREPVIVDKPISSGALLELNPGVVNEQGESWACVQVRSTPEGVQSDTIGPRMVHTDKPISGEPLLGIYPVALILWRGGKPVVVHEIAMFDVRYRRITKAEERPAFHLFY